jgi:hypothetical protein
MSIISGSPSFNPYTAMSNRSSSSGNPELDFQVERSKHIQVEGLRLGNDSNHDTNYKAAAEKRR